MPSVLQDLRFARRVLVRSPVFTAVVVLTLALGIGLNTAAFSAVDALLLRPLPGVTASNEIDQVYRASPGGMTYEANSIPHYCDVRDRSSDVFSGVASWSVEPMSLAVGGRSQRVIGSMESANFFSVLGVRAARGRLFLPEEDQGRGAHPVAVLSYATWKGLFGGDVGVVGREIVFNGQNYSLVGVTAEPFRGALPVVSPSLYVPLMQFDHVHPGQPTGFEARGSNFMSVVARLKAGVTVDAAREGMKALVAQLRTEHPDEYGKTGITLVRQADAGVHPMFRTAQLGLTSVAMAVVLILLLVACVNVANRDDGAGRRVMIVNQRFVDRFFPGKDPVGQVVKARSGEHTIVGVVPTGKYRRLGEDPTAFMYFAHAQHWDAAMSIHVRTAGDPDAFAPTLRAELSALDATMPLSNVRSMENRLGVALLPARLSGAVLGIFGPLGLLLAAIGTCGVTAYSVAQRTREIGIRMAVGAASGDVVRLVMRQGMSLVAIGMAIGLAGAFGASRLIRGVLYGGGENDPLTFIAVPLVLAAVALLAIWIPARRASVMDPLLALRQE